VSATSSLGKSKILCDAFSVMFWDLCYGAIHVGSDNVIDGNSVWAEKDLGRVLTYTGIQLLYYNLKTRII